MYLKMAPGIGKVKIAASKPYAPFNVDYVEYCRKEIKATKKILIFILIFIFLFAFVRITTSIYENIKRGNNASVQDQETAILHENVVYIGGNDEFVCKLDVNYIKTDDYIDFPEIIKTLLFKK